MKSIEMETHIEEKLLIGKFLGFEVIDYKGYPTFDGHKTAKTIGQKLVLFNGLKFQITGMRVKDLDNKFKYDWNYLMMLVEKCLIGEAETKDSKSINMIYNGLNDIDINETYKAVINYLQKKQHEKRQII